MAKSPRSRGHEFEKLPEFDRALRKLVNVPKAAVEKREQEARRKKKARG